MDVFTISPITANQIALSDRYLTPFINTIQTELLVLRNRLDQLWVDQKLAPFKTISDFNTYVSVKEQYHNCNVYGNTLFLAVLNFYPFFIVKIIS